MRPPRPLLSFGLGLLLLAAHGAAWFWTVRRIEAGFAQWTDAMRAAGWAVAAGAPVWGGWPLAAELVVPAPSLQGGGVAWTGDAVRLRIAPLAPGVLEVRPEGVQRLDVAGLPEIRVAAEAMLGLVPLDTSDTADLSAAGIRAETPWGGLTVAALSGRVTPLLLSARAGGIGTPAGPAAEAAFDAALSAAVPPGRSLSRRAALWRDAGGALLVRRLEARWGALRVEGSGTGGLDAALQPRAEASLRVTGYATALRALSEAGLVSAGGAVAANAVLSLMAQPAGGTAVEVPLALRDGVVRMGRIPLLRLPPLSWPAS